MGGLPVVVFKIIESDADYGMFFENKRGSLPNLQSGVAGGSVPLNSKRSWNFLVGEAKIMNMPKIIKAPKTIFFFCALFKIKIRK